MRIYWIAPVVPGRFPNFWEPKIESIRQKNGNFLSRHVLQGGGGANRYATGVAEVDSDQLTAITKDGEITVLSEKDKSIGEIATEEKTAISDVASAIGIKPASDSTKISAALDNVSTKIANKPLSKLETELDQDITITDAEKINVIVVPGMISALEHIKLYRRQLLRLASLSGLAWLFYRRPAYASVVFTDSFTVGADVDIAQYPSPGAPNYVISSGLDDGAIYVNAANGRVQDISSGVEHSARIVNAAAPTGDQQIVATVFSDANAFPGLTTRATGITGDFYLQFFNKSSDLIEIYRADGGSGNLLTSQSRTVTYPATGTFRAVGTASVDLTASALSVSDVTYSDSDVMYKKTSGTSGFRIFQNVIDTAYIDNVSIDDLSSTGRQKVVFIP